MAIRTRTHIRLVSLACSFFLSRQIFLTFPNRGGLHLDAADDDEEHPNSAFVHEHGSHRDDKFLARPPTAAEERSNSYDPEELSNKTVDYQTIVNRAIAFEPKWSQWLAANYLNRENDPLFGLVADKIRVKDWIRAQNLGISVTKTYWNSSNPRGLHRAVLPSSFVVKGNHMSGGVVRVKDGTDLSTHAPVNKSRLARRYARLLRYTHGRWGEGWYASIRPQVMVEEYLDSALAGGAVVDCKLHVIRERVVLATVISSRFESSDKALQNYNRHWQPVDIEWSKCEMARTCNLGPRPKLEKPACFEDMVRAAERLGRFFPNYVRVDFLLQSNSTFYFGELTFAPEGGAGNVFNPAYVNNVLGYLIAHPEHIELFQNFTYPKIFNDVKY